MPVFMAVVARSRPIMVGDGPLPVEVRTVIGRASNNKFGGRSYGQMKSFRVYLREPTTPPLRLVTEIPPEEQVELRESFKPLARQSRRSRRIAEIIIAVAFGCVLLGFVVPKAYFPWVMGGFFVCWVTLVSMTFFSPPLLCPACHNKVDAGFGLFCPECGARALQPGSWFRAPHCSVCGREMHRGKGRHFSVRACTYCGVWLDDEGL